MVIFNSYVKLPEGIYIDILHVFDLHQHLEHTKQAADDAADRLVPASTDHLGEFTVWKRLGKGLWKTIWDIIYIIYVYLLSI
jgi:hypothetical protein